MNPLELQDGEQGRGELEWLFPQLAGFSSVLEIGSRSGYTLRQFGHACGPGTKLRSIDISDGGRTEEEQRHARGGIRLRVRELRAEGFDADCLIADSASPEAVRWARENGPFDFIFIDGDHDDGVYKDWDNYRSMATKLVGFHDIIIDGHKVKDLWAKIKAAGWKTSEVNINNSMGIGLVDMSHVP